MWLSTEESEKLNEAHKKLELLGSVWLLLDDSKKETHVEEKTVNVYNIQQEYRNMQFDGIFVKKHVMFKFNHIRIKLRCDTNDKQLRLCQVIFDNSGKGTVKFVKPDEYPWKYSI